MDPRNDIYRCFKVQMRGAYNNIVHINRIVTIITSIPPKIRDKVDM